jgi:hypothetical protein
LQDWLSDDDVSKWLTKYDWDSSGDISFDEFEALVRGLLVYTQLCTIQHQRSEEQH